MAYTGFWKRFFAYIIDAIIILFFTLALILSVLFFAFGGIESVRNFESGLYSLVVIFLFIAINLAQLVYYAGFESSKYQATIGKLIAGIKVTDEKGERLTQGKAFIRGIVKMIQSNSLMFLFVICAFTGKKQNLHDLAAGSVVLEKNPETAKKRGLIIGIIFIIAAFFFIGTLSMLFLYPRTIMERIANTSEEDKHSLLPWQKHTFEDISLTIESPYGFELEENRYWGKSNGSETVIYLTDIDDSLTKSVTTWVEKHAANKGLPIKKTTKDIAISGIKGTETIIESDDPDFIFDGRIIVLDKNGERYVIALIASNSYTNDKIISSIVIK